MIHQEITNDTWIRALRGKITTATQVEEFISLLIRLQNILLQPAVEDKVTWKWSADGRYTTK